MHFEVYIKSILFSNRKILCYNQLDYVFLVRQILANESVSKLITYHPKEIRILRVSESMFGIEVLFGQ